MWEIPCRNNLEWRPIGTIVPIPALAGVAARLAPKLLGAAKVGSVAATGAALGGGGGPKPEDEAQSKFEQKTAEKANEQATTTSAGPLARSHNVGMQAAWDNLLKGR
tara:strand:- start:601 stop:921 length:321 start_codon:yes stop_codon:yes gene_type:complete